MRWPQPIKNRNWNFWNFRKTQNIFDQISENWLRFALPALFDKIFEIFRSVRDFFIPWSFLYNNISMSYRNLKIRGFSYFSKTLIFSIKLSKIDKISSFQALSSKFSKSLDVVENFWYLNHYRRMKFCWVMTPCNSVGNCQKVPDFAKVIETRFNVVQFYSDARCDLKKKMLI